MFEANVSEDHITETNLCLIYELAIKQSNTLKFIFHLTLPKRMEILNWHDCTAKYQGSLDKMTIVKKLMQ